MKLTVFRVATLGVPLLSSSKINGGYSGTVVYVLYNIGMGVRYEISFEAGGKSVRTEETIYLQVNKSKKRKSSCPGHHSTRVDLVDIYSTNVTYESTRPANAITTVHA